MSKLTKLQGLVIKDALIFVVSVVFALVLIQSGLVNWILSNENIGFTLLSFVSGIFFTSMFTIAPASVVLVKISEFYPSPTIIFLGALGAVFGDLIIFLFIKNNFSDDIHHIIKNLNFRKYAIASHFGFLRWVIPVIGALIIASPLPDELGLAMMGLSKMKLWIFIPVAFLMNALGIYLIIEFGKVL